MLAELTSDGAGVTTWTLPLVAPAGTVVVISELDATLKMAAAPLVVTLAAPVRLVPRIWAAGPGLPVASLRLHKQAQAYSQP